VLARLGRVGRWMFDVGRSSSLTAPPPCPMLLASKLPGFLASQLVFPFDLPEVYPPWEGRQVLARPPKAGKPMASWTLDLPAMP
jgi:hypothetical protein